LPGHGARSCFRVKGNHARLATPAELTARAESWISWTWLRMPLEAISFLRFLLSLRGLPAAPEHQGLPRGRMWRRRWAPRDGGRPEDEYEFSPAGISPFSSASTVFAHSAL